jgi:glycosyltransferase involved in cell wall biosynthesis
MVQISIIIPHFNCIDGLNRLLKTIPHKEEIQIIVVDDNSTNCISDFIKIKNDSRFRHVMFISNSTGVKGAGVCRNIGIGLAKGNWIIFADSDDFFLREFYDILKLFYDSSNDVIFFRPTSYEVDSGKTSDRHIFYENIINEYLNGNSVKGELLLRYAFHVPWSKMINTKFKNENNSIGSRLCWPI